MFLASTTSSYILTIDENGQVIESTFLDDIKLLVDKLGGEITHEYMLIKGFTLDLSDDMVPTLQEKLQEIKDKFNCHIFLEKDSEVHAYSAHEY